MRPSDVTHLVIHCSDSRWGDVAEITSWHRERGFREIGYHYLITNAHPRGTRVKDPAQDGVCHPGREPTKAGAHALGFNSRSIGICLIGRGSRDFTRAQMDTLRRVCRDLMKRYGVPAAKVIGHYETPKAGGKVCPGMDMAAFRRSL